MYVIEKLDEVFAEPGFAAGFGMKLFTAGAGRFDGPVQGLGPCLPVTLMGVFETPEPFDAKLHVADFVAMDCPHDRGTAEVTCVAEPRFEFNGVIEVRTFEDERQASDVFQFGAEFEGFGPDPAIDWLVAKFQPQLVSPLDVQACVALFVEHDAGHSTAEFGWCSREGEQDHGHDFKRLKFVIGHDVVGDGAFGGVFESLSFGHRGGCAASGEAECIGAGGLINAQSRFWSEVGEFGGAYKLSRELC